MVSRETQNLFFYIKRGQWNRFWYFLKRFNKLTYEDTFMPTICWFLNHRKYQPSHDSEPNEWACKRCHRWVN